MSTKKKPAEITAEPSDTEHVEGAIEPTKPASGKGSRGPRKLIAEGPTNRAVIDAAGDTVALVLNCTTEASAIEAVTGKFSTKVVGISEGITMARQPELKVIDLQVQTTA